jgi:hypothetical protein
MDLKPKKGPYNVSFNFPSYFIGVCPHRFRDYGIGSKFWKFYDIRTSFTLGELVSLTKVFRLFRSDWIDWNGFFWC